MIDTPALPLLNNWQTFYTLIGAAAATLTGLMFVVITLIAGIERQAEVLDAGISAFNTPTVVHFCAVLLTAAILNVPWRSFAGLGLALGLAGLAGVIYLLVVMRRMRRVPGYTTPRHDWIWYFGVPLLAYTILIGAAILFFLQPALALDITGATLLALLFTGIRNAWDMVIFLATERSQPPKNEGQS